MTYGYIRVTFGWHMSTYKYIRVAYGWYTSTYEWHTDDIQVHMNDIRVTYGWHAVRKKNKVYFFKSFLIILFPNIWLVKEFPVCNACFRLFSNIEKRSGISFWCTFSAWFLHANAPYLILYQLAKFQCHIFFLFEDIKQNLLLSSYLDNWWRHELQEIYLQSSSKAMTEGGMVGSQKYQKFEYLENEKNFFSWWSKKHFS